MNNPIKILLVEDESIISLSTSKILKANGFEVLIVHNGLNSIEAIKQEPGIKLVLMDINLGRGIDGTEAADSILKIRALPIIFLTNHSEKDVVEKVKKITSYGYVIKNSGEFVLLESINMALELFAVNQKLKDDITEREKTEEENKNIISLLKATLESTADGLLVVGNDSKIKRYNKRFADMWHIPKEILESKEDEIALKFVNNQLKDPNEFTMKVKMLYQNPEMESFDKIYFKDGRVFERYSIPQMINNEIVGRVWSFRDITSGNEAQKKIKESEARFSKIFHSSPVGISISRVSDGVYIDVNDALLKIGGYQREEVIGHSTIELKVYDEKTRNRFIELMKKHGKVSNEEITFPRKDGSMANVSFSLEIIELNGENYVLGIVADITDKKDYENQLVKSLNEKNILLKELQHRVKNNLSVISSLLNLELQNLPDDNSRNIFRNSITRINSLTSIYEQLYNSENFDKIDLFKYLTKLIDSIDITYKINDKINLITKVKYNSYIDLKRSVVIGLILNELITNSLKYAYADEESGIIEIGFIIESGYGNLYVRDFGIGMPPGFDIESSKSLGLKLVKILSEQLEGILKIIPGVGTNIELRFKL